MSLLNGIKDYLEMHKMERKGISVLVFLLGVIFLAMCIIPYVVQPEMANKEEMEQRIKLLLELEKEQAESQTKEKESQYEPKKAYTDQSQPPKKKAQTLFKFDPNTCSDSEWKDLGLNSGQIKSINNYKNKGGKFFSPEDLGKMYTIDASQYAELKPYIRIDQSQFAQKESNSENKYKNTWDENPNSEPKVEEIIYLNLNKADTLELDKLSGIGPYYARKIVEYRSELGGFINQNQLLEIWNFKPETLEKISDQIHLGEETVEQISINHCNAEEIANHPYFNWKMAKALVSYRDTHGPYSSIEEITKSHLISEEACLKMKPYLKLN